MRKAVVPGTFSPSVIFLIAANIVPLLGGIFFDWNLFQIIFLYWLESAVFGFYYIIKLIKVSGLLSILIVPFFVVHYGGFMAGHLLFIVLLFAPELTSSPSPSLQETIIPLLKVTALPLIVLFASHGISFFYNFVGKREYERTNAGKLMHALYRRITLMHLTIIFGGWFILLFKEPALGLALLVVLKTIADTRAHMKEHSLKSQPPT